jgi:biopolymer transport protein ExbD
MTALIAGRGAQPRFSTHHNHEINVTPFVDVMLVLLIVFIIAAPLATNTLKLDLPRVDQGARTPPHLAIISIDAAGRIYVSAGAGSMRPRSSTSWTRRSPRRVRRPRRTSRCRLTSASATVASSRC